MYLSVVTYVYVKSKIQLEVNSTTVKCKFQSHKYLCYVQITQIAK